jgi:hypothetical protein
MKDLEIWHIIVYIFVPKEDSHVFERDSEKDSKCP